MKEKSQVQIFLSYGREDATRVKELYQWLKGDGYQPWLDTEDILPGEDWQGKIQDTIAHSDLLIACLSRSVTSRTTYVSQELRQALVQFARSQPGEVFVIPLRLDECEIPNLRIPELGMNLRNYNALDYWQPDAYDRLLRTIEQKRGNLVPPPASAVSGARSQTPPQTYHNQIAFQNAQVSGNLTTGDIIQVTKVINEAPRIEIDEQQVLRALNSHSQIILDGISSTIGKELHLDRDQLVQQVLQQLELKQVVLISGPAGTGKSAIAKDTLERLSTEYLTFSFRAEAFAASHFDETLNKNQIPANGEQLSTILANQNRKVLLVESIERLLEKSTRDAFIDLLKLIGKDPNWRLILTCRDYSVNLIRSAFLDFANVEHSTLKIPSLSNDELEQVKATYPSLIHPLSNSSLSELLSNPYFLDKALQISWSEDKPLPQSESELRTRFWKEIVCAEHRVAKGMPRRREEAFIKIALGRAQKLDLYVACPDLDSEVVESLRYDSLIVFSERNNELMAVAHDVLEDWAILQWINKQYATYQDSLPELSEQLGTHPAVRRGYRKWVAEQVEQDSEMADTLFQDTICEEDLSAQFRDDTIISLLRSPASVAFLEKHRAKLFANNKELLRRIIHLLRVACVTIRDQIDPSKTSISVFNVPEGSVWYCVLRLVETHLDSFIQEDYPLLLGLIEDWSHGVSWQNPYPDGAESVAAIAYWLLSEFNDYRFQHQWKQTLKIIAKIPNADTERFVALLQGDHDDEEKHRARGELLEMILTGSHEGIAIARDMPKTLVSVARKYLLLSEIDLQPRFYGRLDLGPLFGLRAGLDHCFFFPSAYRGPFLMLLRYHPSQGLNFIIKVFNHSAEWYAHPRVPSEVVESPYQITLTFSDGTSGTQWCNDRLWNFYRGTSVGPYVLQSLLMALEQWLLELAEVLPNDLDNALISILKRSDSVCLTAVVASVATAYPHRCGETLLVLLKSPECIQLDRYRLAKEVEAGIIFGFNPEDALHRKEREKANSLPHRDHDLEVAILNLQLGAYATQVQEFLDQYYTEMPPLEEQDDNDRLWRLKISRMDRRNYPIIEETSQEKQDKIPIYPKIASDLKEMVDKHQSQSKVMSAGISLFMWGQKIFQGKEDDTANAAQWQQRLQEAQKRNLEDDGSGKYNLLYPGSMGYVAAVCIRNHWEEMSKYEQNWCVEVVCSEVERQGDSWNQFNRIQKSSMSGDRPCAQVLPLLLGKTLDQTYTSCVHKAFLTALTHAIEEVRHYAALGIGKYLWEIDPELTLRCVNAIAWEAVLIEQGIKDRPHNKRREFEEIRMEVATHLRQRFYEHDFIPDDAYQKMDIETLLGSEVNVRILRVLGQAPNDDTAIAAFERLAQMFVRWWDEDAQKRKSIEQQPRQRNYEIEQELSNLLQDFVLHTSRAVATTTLQPILDAVDHHPQQIHWILSGLIMLEDSQPNTSRFWMLWDLFADRVRQAKWLATIDNEYVTGKDMISAIFLGKYWKDGVRHWNSLEGYAERIHKLFEDLPASSTILEKYLEFLYSVGSQSLPQAFINIAKRLQQGNSQQMLSKTNNVFLIEMLLQRYVYGKPLELKRKAKLRDAVLFLLDLLVENASSAAFRMRDDFVTPVSISTDKTM